MTLQRRCYTFVHKFLQCRILHRPLWILLANPSFVMFENQLIHVTIWFKHGVDRVLWVRRHSGATRICQCTRGVATRLVHWLILVASSCFPSYNARYIMLKSFNKRCHSFSPEFVPSLVTPVCYLVYHEICNWFSSICNSIANKTSPLVF